MTEASRSSSSVSWQRVLLLLGLLGTGAVAFTPPGQWAAATTIDRFRQRLHGPAALLLPNSSDTTCRNATYHAFLDMHFDRDVPEDSRTVPTLTLVAKRLAALPGWSTAVMFEPGCGPGAIHAAGLDDLELCGRIVGSLGHTQSWSADGPLRFWSLVLLDGEGRCCGHDFLQGVRPGWARTVDGPGDFVERLAAPGDGALPAASVFRRQADGTVLGG